MAFVKGSGETTFASAMISDFVSLECELHSTGRGSEGVPVIGTRQMVQAGWTLVGSKGEAWHLRHWAGSGDSLGQRWSPAPLRGRRGTWRHLFCVAGLALTALGWLATSAFVLRGKRGDICLRFVWHLRHWAGSGGILGQRWSPGAPHLFCMAGGTWGHLWRRGTWCGRRGTYGIGLALVTALVRAGRLGRASFAWQVWHLATSAFVLRGRRGTWVTSAFVLCGRRGTYGHSFPTNLFRSFHHLTAGRECAMDPGVVRQLDVRALLVTLLVILSEIIRRFRIPVQLDFAVNPVDVEQPAPVNPPRARSSAPNFSGTPLARPIAQSPVSLSLKRQPIWNASSSASDVVLEPPKIPRVCSVPSLLSPTLPGPKPSASSQMILVKRCSSNSMLMDRWLSLLHSLGDCSETWTLLQKSVHWKEHAGRILDGSAPSTAMKYISACTNFLQTLTEMRVPLATLSDVQMADILVTMSLAKSSSGSGGSCAATIKALRWLHRVAGVSILQLVHSAMINSFLVQKIPRDRKEAPPLPLWLLVQWERRILMSSCSTPEIILLGSFLLMAWASLRFSDAQRIEMHRMVLTASELRGIIWRSKTTTLGMPFGAINSGLLSKGDHSWMWKFISTVEGILHQNQAADVDFLLPHCDADGIQFPLTPMTYATALFHLRRLLHCPWRSSSNPMLGLDLNFTLHSLKATLLSWGPQLASYTNPEQRLQQGHHVSQSSSLAVYSRDNVWGALDFQRQIIQQVRSGWRPQIAQHRGSQRPLQEPPVVLEIFSKKLPDYRFQWFEFGAQSAPALDLSDPLVTEDSDSDSTSSSTSSTSDEEEQRQDQAPAAAAAPSKPSGSKGIFPETLVYGQYRCVVHAMIAAGEPAHWLPQRDGVHLKPACGRPMKSNGKLLDCVTAEHQLCQHAACRKLWAHFNLESEA
eukprot:s1556_g11.t1